MIRKIRYKLFLVLSLTGVVSVFATALSIHWNTERNFTQYRDLADAERLDGFVTTLRSYYISWGSWDNLINSNDLLELLGPRGRNNRNARPPRNAQGDSGERPERQGPRGAGPGEPGSRDSRPRDFRPPPPRPNDAERRAGGDKPPPHRPTFPHRLILFDISGNKISGIKDIAKTKKEIIVDGERVGWLGIADDDEQRFSPIETAFLEQERNAFFLALSIVSIMSLLIALVYSKHFETPLTHLARLARRLTEGDFSARSKVSRKDELGELSIDLNILANTLEKNEAMREQWIADTSHELKTPVTILRGEIEALRDGIRQPNDEALSSLHEEIEHLSKLIDDLNTLSQADNKSLKFDMKEISVDRLIKDVCSHAQALANEKQFQITQSLLASTNILADGTRLKQVFDNLIMNSFRYSSAPGAIHIETKILRQNNNNCIEITFEDTPPCPSHEEIDRIFERFYRTESSRNRKTGGRGLGLAICRHIIESHGGSIEAYAAKTGGMGIRIQLPKL